MNPEQPASSDTIRKHSPTIWERIRRMFLAGFLVIVPAVIAIYALLVIMGIAEWLFGGLIDGVIQSAAPDLRADSPFLRIPKALVAFILAAAVVLFVGWLSTFFVVRKLISIGESIIQRVPIIKFFYNVPKEVLNTFTSSRSNSFKRVVLVQYPRQGVWAFGFATGEMYREPDREAIVAVFIPTTPNPTSGFLIYFNKAEVLDTNLTVEEGARLIISGGILGPPELITQKFSGLMVEPLLPPVGPMNEQTAFDPDALIPPAAKVIHKEQD